MKNVLRRLFSNINIGLFWLLTTVNIVIGVLFLYIIFKLLCLNALIGDMYLSFMALILLEYCLIIVLRNRYYNEIYNTKTVLTITVLIIISVGSIFTNFYKDEHIFVKINKNTKCSTGILIINPFELYKVQKIIFVPKIRESKECFRTKVKNINYIITIDSKYYLSTKKTIDIIDSNKKTTPYISSNDFEKVPKENKIDEEILGTALLEIFNSDETNYPWKMTHIDVDISTISECKE